MTYVFELSDGREVEFEWTDSDEMKVWTRDSNRELIESFEFTHVEGADESGSRDYYRLTQMYLEGPPGRGGYARCGIGREIIRQVRCIYPIVFSPDDGQTRDDGSHLTGGGPGFARKMIRERLASWES